MAVDSLIVGILNIVAGLLILLIRGSLRFIVGGYLVLAGLIMLVVQLM